MASFGIGVQVTRKRGGHAVLSIHQGSPAHNAGIIPGDVIVAADGKATANFKSIAHLLAGPEGSEVHLLLNRGDSMLEAYVRREMQLPSRASRRVQLAAVPSLPPRSQTVEARLNQSASRVTASLKGENGLFDRFNDGGKVLSDQQLVQVIAFFDDDEDGTLDERELANLAADYSSANRIRFEQAQAALSAVFKRSPVGIEDLRLGWNTFVRKASGNRKSALIIVDMQNDFITGSLKVNGGTDIVQPINQLRDKFGFDLVAHTQDWHPADHMSFADNNDAELFSVKVIDGLDQVMWPRHCVRGSPGSQFHDDLVVLSSDLIVRKGLQQNIDSYSGFYDNGKAAQSELRTTLALLGITDVYVVGLAYDYCVGSTAIDSQEAGFRTTLLTDLSRHVAEESAKEMNARLQAAGVVQCTVDEAFP